MDLPCTSLAVKLTFDDQSGGKPNWRFRPGAVTRGALLISP